jgi:hypothetical protein
VLFDYVVSAAAGAVVVVVVSKLVVVRVVGGQQDGTGLRVVDVVDERLTRGRANDEERLRRRGLMAAVLVARSRRRRRRRITVTVVVVSVWARFVATLVSARPRTTLLSLVPAVGVDGESVLLCGGGDGGSCGSGVDDPRHEPAERRWRPLLVR